MRGNKALLIGITGTIGSGKSSFCKYLEAEGRSVIYADDTANKYLLKQKERLVARWGTEILEGGELSNSKIAKIVFNNKEELNWLNSQIHPQVLKEFQELAESSKAPYLFFEIPLLFETDLKDCFDHIVMIQTDMSKTIRRVAKRDGSTRQEVLLRIAKQFPDYIKAAMADKVILNNGTRQELKAAAKAWLKELENLKPRRNKKPFI